MSVNPISPGTLWWTPRHQQKHHPLMISASNSKSLTFANHFSNYNLNHNDDRGRRAEVVNILSNGGLQQQQLEVMFEKPLTPSDVGKLNRLVIPKQHAERHLPLNTSNGADSGGMLLSFEDEAGKFWRFRYSYWNSSQSYVLTKGWSRYVKEKQLDTGDVVLFKRHPTDPDRLFIAWRRRRHDPAQMELSNTSTVAACSSAVSCKEFYPAHHHQAYNVYLYRPDTEASAAGVNQSRSFNWSSSSRTLRLFGVNMEYQFESDQLEPANPDGSSTSSPRRQQVQQNASHSQHRR